MGSSGRATNTPAITHAESIAKLEPVGVQFLLVLILAVGVVGSGAAATWLWVRDRNWWLRTGGREILRYAPLALIVFWTNVLIGFFSPELGRPLQLIAALATLGLFAAVVVLSRPAFLLPPGSRDA